MASYANASRSCWIIHPAVGGVVNDEEDAEYAEIPLRDGARVHRGKDLAVVKQEVASPLPRFVVCRSPWHHSRDRAIGNVEAEHEKLTVNARRTPGRGVRLLSRVVP